MSFQPMLAYKAPPRRPLDLGALRYPLLGSPKFDGYRAVVRGGALLSRNLKPIPNMEVRLHFGRMRSLEGCDGELIYGDPTAPDCFKLTSSVVTTRGASREGVRFFVFDSFARPALRFRERAADLQLLRPSPGVQVVQHRMLRNAAQAAAFEAECLAFHYEGAMLRDLDCAYKCGRSTLRGQHLVAVKRFEEFEAEIIKALPRMRNDNEQERSLTGYAKRSKRKAGMVPQPCVGKFEVRELKPHGGRGPIMECSTGQFTLDECVSLWAIRHRLPGMVLKCRRQRDATGKRFPRAAGFRSRIDF